MLGRARQDAGWADLLADGRLPRFALVCLGVWLNAADSLVTATIMPSVGAELGGYAYFSWAVAGFLIGAILAGASAGRLAELFGLRMATTLAGIAFAAGCAISASAPHMGVFLAGRLLQGIGSGWVAGLAMVAIAFLFPERHLARVFAAVAAVWGVATVLGPLVGGLLADAGNWRAVFWLFALQALVFAAAAPFLLKGLMRTERGAGIPWRQLALLTIGVVAIAIADVARMAVVAILLVAAGFAFLALTLRVDARAPVRLFPHRAGDVRTVRGAGYASVFALTAASMGFTVYGPVILQALRGLSPLWAGYVVAVEALAWTLAAFVVAGATPASERGWIRLGGGCVVAGVALLAVLMRDAPLAFVIGAAVVLGAGFGFSSSLTNRRVLAALSDEDRAIGSAALIAVRQMGGATGAAIAGVTANFVGLDEGLDRPSAEAAAIWVFATAVPLAIIGAAAAWRLAGHAARAGNGG
jgi:MFS family permease